MKIGNIKNNIVLNFRQNGEKQENSNNKTVQNPQTYEPVKTLPAQFMNANVPVSYTKINEFTLPGSDIKIQMYKLSNGQTVVLAPKKGESQISTYVKCGGMTEPDNICGISHYIEHNLFNGSKDINPKDFFAKISEMGANTNAYTGSDSTCYYISSHLFDSEDLPKIIQMHSNMVQYPKFEQSMLDKEKGIVNSEITMYDDRNSTILLGKALKQLFQIESTSNDLTCGTVKNINNLTREDVVNYYNKNYTPDKMITVLTGDFEPDKAIELIAKNFTKPASAVQPQYQVDLKPIESSKRIDYISDKIDTDEFALAFMGPEKKDLKNVLCMNIIFDIFSEGKHSKLAKNLKQFNVKPVLIYDSAGTANNSPLYSTITGAGKPEDTENILKTIYSTIHNSKYEDLTEDLEIAKKQRLISYMMNYDTGNSLNNFLGTYLKNYMPEEICKIPEIIKSINQNDIKEAINKYFDLNKASIVVAHPKQKANSPAFKGKLVKQGLNLNEFTQTKLANNAEIYLKNDNREMKEFLLNIKCPVSANINPMLTEVMTKLLNSGHYGQSGEEFSKDMAKKGISLGIFSNDTGISIGASALNSDIDYALRRITDAICCPNFTQQKLDEVKKLIKQEIMESKKEPSDYITQVMFPQLKSAPTKEDKLKALDEIRLEDILGFSEYIRNNASAKFVWNKQDIPYELTRLGQLKPSSQEKMKTYIPLENDVVKVQTDNNSQAKIIQSFKFLEDGSPEEKLKIDILNSILGGSSSSRLFNDLRENQKLAYTVKSLTESYGNTGLIHLKIGTTTDNNADSSASSSNITKALEGFKKHIDKIKNEPVTPEELENAKLQIKSNLLDSLETNSGKMSALLNGILLYNNPNTLNYMLSEVDKITAEDIQKTAQKVFAGKSLTSIVADEKALKEVNLL